MTETKQKEQPTQNKQIKTQLDKQDLDMQKQLAQKDAIIHDYTNHLKRLQAEFENYMKRAEKERNELIQFATEKLISKLLVVLDNFEHAIDNLKKISAPQEIVSGIEMVSKEFNKVLENEGLKQIHAKGCKFDPYLHEVVTCVNKDDCPEDTITEEVQKGYQLGNRTLRYAKVIITKSTQNGAKK